MADRHDYYFRQPVTEAELDEGFAWLEQADWDLIVDQGLDGITSGFGVSEDSGTPDLTVDVAAGTAYSHDGERINVVGSQDVDLSVDDLAVSTAVGSGGNEKWVSLFVEFDRVLGDARIDGASLTVYFDRLESYSFSVVQGVEAGAGLATRPALDPAKVLLCDVLLTFGQTQILNADINTDRRETRAFASSAFAYGGGPAWADGTTNPATTVEGQLDKIITELAQEPAGSDRILSAAIAGSPNALTQASIYGQLGQLLADVNGCLPLTGGTVTGDVTLDDAEIIFTNPRVQSDIGAFGDPGVRAEAMSTIRAWGVIQITNSPAVNLLAGYGISAVAFSGTTVRVTLHNNFAGLQFMCPVGVSDLNAYHLSVVNKGIGASDYFEFTATDDTGTTPDLSSWASGTPLTCQWIIAGEAS